MMDARIYNSQEWRELPRDGECVAEFLFGEAVGPCRGQTHRHHVDPQDEFSRTYQACARHHQKIHVALNHLDARPRWKRCPHIHRTRESRQACERRLNRELAAA